MLPSPMRSSRLPSESVAAVVQQLECDACIVTRVHQRTAAAAARGQPPLPFEGSHVSHELMRQAGKKKPDTLWEEPAKSEGANAK